VSDTASLINLSDIVEPAAITWWPPAPGLVLFGMLILLWTVFAVMFWYRRRQQNAYRRAALQELAAIEERIHQSQTRNEGIRQLSALLKRVALVAYPRRAVASLTGDRWNAFLDRQIGGDTFSNGHGKALALAMVDPNPGQNLTTSDCHRLIQAVRCWISGHRVDKKFSNAAETGM